MGILNQFRERPIQCVYPTVSVGRIRSLQQHAQVRALQDGPGLELANEYFREGLAGSQPTMVVRASVQHRIERLRRYALRDGYGVRIFDAFRTKRTQAAIFEKFERDICLAHPDWSSEIIRIEALRYVAPPDNSRYPVLPHNSGGALDLVLTRDGQPIDMGTPFDSPAVLSETTYFEGVQGPYSEMSVERWRRVKENRRMLFHIMCYLGFTAHEREWWHFDLGNCRWANIYRSAWYYPSMEEEVMAL
ncbi:MAG: D-alanyl-D-alanine carboxypeptidase family protein [Deltaproteobacteria bacterium]|nr:D-alanyl-D-alanine carboxypeptidase family protein [Deltaproteobacteria bacterium]